MSFTYKNKSQLKKDILAYAERNDNKVVTRLDAFISHAEDVLDSELRIPPMETQRAFTLKAGQQSISFPSEYLEMKRMFYADTGEPIYRQSFENLSINGQRKGYPTAYARSGSQLFFDSMPTVDIDIVFVYYSKPKKMVRDADVNVYLEQAPYALLYLALADVFRLLGGDEYASWKQQGEEEIIRLNIRTDDAEFEGSTLINAWDNSGEISMYY